MKPGRYGMPRNHVAWQQVNTTDHQKRYTLPKHWDEGIDEILEAHREKTQRMFDDASADLTRRKDERIDKQLEEWGF